MDLKFATLCWLTYRFSREKLFSGFEILSSAPKARTKKDVPSLSLHNIGKWIIRTGHETIPRAYWILMEKYSHATSIRGE